MDRLEQRLIAVERRCRFQAGAICLLASISAVAVFAGARLNDQPASLRVRRIEVVDEQGKVRAAIGSLGEHEGVDHFALVVQSADGAKRITLNDECQLAMTSGDGRLLVSARPGGGAIAIKAGDKMRATLSVHNARSELQLRDATGEMEHWIATKVP